MSLKLVAYRAAIVVAAAPILAAWNDWSWSVAVVYVLVGISLFALADSIRLERRRRKGLDPK